ncbi:MAG TPA: fimbria/pilus outer membrane usher protein [Ramlibacter sp.]|nr:fimbria/pilus outer membrane usher protein [Ramlibacter sp.]
MKAATLSRTALFGATACMLLASRVALGQDGRRTNQVPAVPAPGQVSPTSLDEPTVMQLRPYDVTLNGASVGNWVLLDRNGALFAPITALEEWRLQRRPGLPTLMHRGEEWFPLAAIAGYQAQFNPAEQAVALRFQPDAFAATRLVQERAERPALTPAIPAAFLNYDFSLTRSSARGASTSNDLGGLFELGVSNRWGVVTSTFLARNITDSDPVNNPRLFRRLETNYSYDFPQRNLSLRVGDSTTRSSSWGRAIFFGGVQIGTNYGLTPGFITQPLPILSGISSAPSTVDLYINDALRQTSRVPAGPFAIDNFPVLAGGGEARLVVRDVLGRETVIVQNFFSHSSLLEQGLNDWSVEVGAVRNNLGTENADYDDRFASALLRRGFSKSLTLEGKIEASRHTRGVGVGVVVGLPFQLLAQAAVAGSQNPAAGTGYLWQGAVTHTSSHHGFAVNVQGANPAYRQVGQDDASPSYRRQLQASYNYQASWGAVGLAYALVDSPDRGRITTYNANYSVTLPHNSVLTASVVRVKDPSVSGGGTSFGLSLFVPLANDINSSSALRHRPGSTEGFVSFAKSLTTDVGWSWRALGGTRDGEPYAEGGIYLQTTRTLTTLDVAQSRTNQTIRMGLQGGFVAADGQVFASRRVSDSFAIVEVPGYPDVGISVYGNVVARTDAKGRALVPRLLPYQANDIRLDPTELPISAELDSIEQRTVPATRSAVKVVFPVRTGRGALVRIVFEDGEPAPAGAELELVGDKQEFFVARRGEAFITGLQDRNQVKLSWRGGSCLFQVDLPPGSIDEVARVGPVVCAGVKR